MLIMGGAMHAYGQVVYGQSLYFLLNFAVTKRTAQNNFFKEIMSKMFAYCS